MTKHEKRFIIRKLTNYSEPFNYSFANNFPKGDENVQRLTGLIISSLDNSIKRAVGRRMHVFEERFGLTPTQNWVLAYINNRNGEDTDVFQRDIEAHFNIQRSTATGILQLMEKNGLISRESLDSDARMKRIVVTQKGREVCEMSRSAKDEMEAELLRGIPAEDLEAFLRVCEAIGENAANIS